MSSISSHVMKFFLSKSISSINRNKLNGMLAEIDLRNMLSRLGFGDRISQGGWIVRTEGQGTFAHHTNVLFPETIKPDISYPEERKYEEPPRGLHTICSTMHQIGIHSYYCVPVIKEKDNYDSVKWFSTQLGIPSTTPYREMVSSIDNYNSRERNYNFLRFHSDASVIPEHFMAEEFTKEHLRVAFQSRYFCEISDIDGVLWGKQYTYPVEIKEKTFAIDNRVGEYFGIDAGPFVKLAFYAAKRGNLHSLFIVKEIDNAEERNLINWWFITFDMLAQFASWVPIAGGRNMGGGGSSVIKIPKSEFMLLNKENIDRL